MLHIVPIGFVAGGVSLNLVGANRTLVRRASNNCSIAIETNLARSLSQCKSAGKREQNEVFFDYAKREQTRGENKSEAPAEKGPISMLKDLVFSHLKVTKKRWGVQGKRWLSKKLSKNGVFFDKRVKEK